MMTVIKPTEEEIDDLVQGGGGLDVKYHPKIDMDSVTSGINCSFSRVLLPQHFSFRKTYSSLSSPHTQTHAYTHALTGIIIKTVNQRSVTVENILRHAMSVCR